MSFESQFFASFFQAIHEDHEANWDTRRFGPENRHFDIAGASHNMRFTLANFDYCGGVYDQLSDEPSRDYLVRFLLYKILGHRHVRMPRNNLSYWESYNSVESFLLERAPSPFPSQWLPVPIYVHRYGLTYHGTELVVNTSDVSLLETLLLEQYRYRQGAIDVGVSTGAIVIDAGACWGDTSLAFSILAGSQGRVFAFEMIGENLAVLRRNLAENQELARTIEVIEAPLAAVSGEEYWVTSNGAASTLTRVPGTGTRVLSTCIDDFVREAGLKKVDFIKFDIEGAENQALVGAAETIRAFHPKLAVSVYHKNEDILEIPSTIQKLNPNYRLYLQGACLNHGETILFATP